ncbi:FMN-dependent NADH-azoreductase [Variovorax ginsengisoli]|uniref:FMN dependent NADH:quinone oxidoreductase n=1 Tax=Variovorax ginsengisoli TaxID=363844 RepID=A0ABT9S640_9BURK|nr:NAD(P)H-dependent oxidoreductase [Variovorax ginsengisoli]MDP9898802.1 FMN-dependent NADH-azoreductase [Variovorax ginsengisoli]
MKLLHIDSSVLGAHSVSRQLTAEVVAQWRNAHPDTTVEYLDLAANAPAHFGADALGIKVGIQAEPTPAQRAENAVSEQLITQFLAADVIVVGAPLYNFSVPSQLKAWIDRLAQAGRTFKYTEKGPIGLAGDKTVIVVSTRGGMYATSEAGQALEHQESYLKVVFGFFGISDVRIVRAEGLAMGEAGKTAALAAARSDIAAVLADTPIAQSA